MRNLSFYIVVLLTLGACSPANSETEQRRGSGGGRSGPPQETITACSNKDLNASCTVETSHGTHAGTCLNVKDSIRACVPEGHEKGGGGRKPR